MLGYINLFYKEKGGEEKRGESENTERKTHIKEDLNLNPFQRSQKPLHFK
jgi:hypothetical protein